jgi:GT2 family glycosyltransferase
MWPLVTVNVLAYNRRDDLRVTLEAVTQRLDYPADRLEIIVVDNASTDGTEAMLREEFPAVQVVRKEANVGIPAWNEGFARGSGEYFLALDDDCYVEGDALKRAITEARAHDADLVSFRVASPFLEGYYFNDAYNAGLLTFWGCAALMSRRAIDRLDGFDPGIFIFAHELEFTARLLDAGLAHLYLPDVVAVHMSRPPFRGDEGYPKAMKSLAYVAAKSLRPFDLAIAWSSLLTEYGVRLVRRRADRAALVAFRDGARAGLKARRPLRREVSAAYRANLMEYRNPLRLVRGPVSRLRTRSDAERALRDRLALRDSFYVARRRFYPTQAGSIRL